MGEVLNGGVVHVGRIKKAEGFFMFHPSAFFFYFFYGNVNLINRLYSPSLTHT